MVYTRVNKEDRMSEQRTIERKIELTDALTAINIALEIEYSFELHQAREVVRLERTAWVEKHGLER